MKLYKRKIIIQKIKLKFTPLEFETSMKKLTDYQIAFVKIYSVGV
ncbi:hypothetical protein CAMRE0001_0217 [Campylobacter rectus RM3267]|uniref:Uncharacterized protein n=1 Tax=Campylobacter rectus RM3267 TaxID=553218 RepID=B9CY22_CAMRE|nr:hypothetical protein CAMRE0001_0217 [Campylobacter rectus RM3267]